MPLHSMLGENKTMHTNVFGTLKELKMFPYYYALIIMAFMNMQRLRTTPKESFLNRRA